MNQKLNKMNEKLRELMTFYQKGHFITNNHYFTETIQKMKEKRRETKIVRRLRKFLDRKKNAAIKSVKIKNTKMFDLLSAFAFSIETDMNRYACFEILDCMRTF